MELDVDEPDIVAGAVPDAELERRVASAERTPEQNQEVAGPLVVGDVPDPLCRRRLRYPGKQNRWRAERRRRPRGAACIDGDLNHRDPSWFRRSPLAEQERIRARIPRKALDVEPALIRFQFAGLAE